MGEDLVYIAKGEILCDSRLVADKLADGKHARVKNVIEKLIVRHESFKGKRRLPLNDYEPIWALKKSIYRGQPFSYYEMNKTAFSLVAMRFQTDEAYEWQLKFIATFQEMEKILLRSESNQKNLEWKQQREQGKLARKEETDTIQKFVALAESQGSKGAKWYYKHFTNATYKALQLIELKKPKLRDTLDMLELNQLILAENVAMRSLEENMASGEHYKAIFVNVKNDIEKFASTLFLPQSKKEIK